MVFEAEIDGEADSKFLVLVMKTWTLPCCAVGIYTGTSCIVYGWAQADARVTEKSPLA